MLLTGCTCKEQGERAKCGSCKAEEHITDKHTACCGSVKMTIKPCGCGVTSSLSDASKAADSTTDESKADDGKADQSKPEDGNVDAKKADDNKATESKAEEDNEDDTTSYLSEDDSHGMISSQSSPESEPSDDGPYNHNTIPWFMRNEDIRG